MTEREADTRRSPRLRLWFWFRFTSTPRIKSNFQTNIPRRIRSRQRVVEDVAVGVEPLAVAVALYKEVDAQEMAEVGS